jgi:glycosyltransferase involved in cell wall biosynthesis
MTPKVFPFITITMPVRNEERFVAQTLSELLEQDYPKDRYEIIVADGESADRTRKIVRQIARIHTQVIYMKNPGRLPSSGRNVGFRKGKGDIFVVIDGHCKINNRQMLKDIVRCFEISGAQCLGRPQPLNPPGLSVFQKAVALARASRVGHSTNSLIYSNSEGFISPVSNGAIYKREVFEKVGYVDESFDACEDVEFNYRLEKAGLTAYMSPVLNVQYYPRENLSSLFRQMMRYGKGRFNFIRKHPDALNIDILIPALFVLGLLIGPLTIFLNIITKSTVSSLIPTIWIIAVGLYLLLILGESLRIFIKNRSSCAIYIPIIFFAIHFGLGCGFLNGLFFSHQTSRR